MRAFVERARLDPARIDDVVFAQSYMNGETPCTGRWVALQAGLPIGVAGMQLDRRCGGGLQAMATAAMACLVALVPLRSALAHPDAPVNPFAGSWAGPYTFLPNGFDGEQAFTVTDEGVTQGIFGPVGGPPAGTFQGAAVDAALLQPIQVTNALGVSLGP